MGDAVRKEMSALSVQDLGGCCGLDRGACWRPMPGNARRQRRHLGQSRQRGFCKLQIRKPLIGFESHPLRHRLAQVSSCRRWRWPGSTLSKPR
jgi:hypothetical protein